MIEVSESKIFDSNVCNCGICVHACGTCPIDGRWENCSRNYELLTPIERLGLHRTGTRPMNKIFAVISVKGGKPVIDLGNTAEYMVVESKNGNMCIVERGQYETS